MTPLPANTIRLPPRLCPTCGSLLDAATPAASSRGAATRTAPAAGDITLCLRCGEILQFTSATVFSKPSGPELADILAKEPALGLYVMRLRAESWPPGHNAGGHA